MKFRECLWIQRILWMWFSKMRLAKWIFRDISWRQSRPLSSGLWVTPCIPEENILPLTLGSGKTVNTVMTSFTVVESPSSYNIILVRSAMSAFRAVTSTYHQKIKFPVGSRVGEVKGDQPSSRKCYDETVRVERRERELGKGVKCSVWGKMQKTVEEEQEDIVVVPGKTGKTTKIARDLDPSTWARLLKCLKDNAKFFSWSSLELV